MGDLAELGGVTSNSSARLLCFIPPSLHCFVSVADRETQRVLEQSENNTGGGEMQPHRSRDENSSRKRR